MTSEITKICLICMDRTGSNMISSRLNTHSNIVFYNEIFHRQYIIFHDDRVSGNDHLVARRDRSPAAFVSSIWNGEFEPKEQRERIHGIGFKLFLNHSAEALRHVINSDAKIVFLRRRNALARFSSFKIAAVTGEWKSIGSVGKKPVKVNFRPEEFRAYMQNYLSLETLFEMTLLRWNRSYFDASYEDVTSHPVAWANMTTYLGFDPKDFSESLLVKQNASNVLSRFSNPDDVEKFVADINRYDWLSE